MEEAKYYYHIGHDTKKAFTLDGFKEFDSLQELADEYYGCDFLKALKDEEYVFDEFDMLRFVVLGEGMYYDFELILANIGMLNTSELEMFNNFADMSFELKEIYKKEYERNFNKWIKKYNMREI